LAEGSVVSYKCTAEYAPDRERSIRWDDPSIGVDWPVQAPVLSDKDAAAPLLADAEVFPEETT
jgi:dTDP-4-dehydrorhamnose 3,5-epimerase